MVLPENGVRLRKTYFDDDQTFSFKRMQFSIKQE